MEDQGDISGGVNVYFRIPAELEKRLRIAIAGERISKPKAIARAVGAWLDALESQGTPDKPASIPKNGKSDVPHADCPKDSASPLQEVPYVSLQSSGPKIQQIQITEDEWRWVERLLKVLRGGHGKATEALDTNLDAFTLLTDLAQGEQHGRAPTVSPAPMSPADTQREVDALRDSLAASGEDVERARKAAESAGKPRKNPGRAKGGNQ